MGLGEVRKEGGQEVQDYLFRILCRLGLQQIRSLKVDEGQACKCPEQIARTLSKGVDNGRFL